LYPRRAKDGHGGFDIPELFKGVHEFGHDFEKTPGVFIGEVVDEILLGVGHGGHRMLLADNRFIL
jgi:hypothetical protein